MTNIKKSNQKNIGVNPVVAAMAGAVVAGVAVAGAIAMSNKDNQEKVKNVISDVKADIDNKKSEVVNKSQKLETIAKKAIQDVKQI